MKDLYEKSSFSNHDSRDLTAQGNSLKRMSEEVHLKEPDDA